MSEPKRFDPSVPLFLDAPASSSFKFRFYSDQNVKEVAMEPVNPMISFLTNPSMTKKDSDDEAPSTEALPVIW